jgi:hypothetical protein
MLKRALESLVTGGFADHTEGNNLFQVRYCDIGECHIFGNGYDYDDAIHYADALSYGENSVVTQCHGSGGCQLFSVGMFEINEWKLEWGDVREKSGVLPGVRHVLDGVVLVDLYPVSGIDPKGTHFGMFENVLIDN